MNIFFKKIDYQSNNITNKNQSALERARFKPTLVDRKNQMEFEDYDFSGEIKKIIQKDEVSFWV